MRLIDADEFFKDFTELEPYEHISHEYDIDAVEVVRCKDCKYWNTYAIGICNLHDIRPTPLIMDDWFCADGERR